MISIQGTSSAKMPYSLLFFIVVVYFVGFVFQIFGWLSITQTNVLALFLLFSFLFFNGALSFRLKKHTISFYILSVLMLVVGVINGSDFLGFLVYIYYLGAALVMLSAATLTADKGFISARKLERFLPFYLMVQILVCSIQKTIPDKILDFSKTQLSIEDTVSGTFYLASDASLAFCCMLLSIFFLSYQGGFARKALIILLGTVIVFLTNSKAMQLLHLMVLVSAVVSAVVHRHPARRMVVYVCALLVAVCICLVFLDDIIVACDDALSVLHHAYDRRLNGPAAHRLAPFGEILFGDLSIFGSGFIAYFNPIAKTWLYYSGFSLFYTIYIDCGLVGLAVIYGGFFWIIMKNSVSLAMGCITFAAFFAFSVFNFALTDLSVLFTLFMILRLLRNNRCSS
ncbi:hypothetical protein IAE37_005158 [Pseudomonas sp. S31]|nr:hypothetical protein [Pseudomonas sp. S31]